MMSIRLAIMLCALATSFTAAQAGCPDPLRRDCREDRRRPRIVDPAQTVRPPAKASPSAVRRRPAASASSGTVVAPVSSRPASHFQWATGGRAAVARAGSRPLQPVRAYLPAADIPPADVGAYGLVVFHSKPTPANRSKLLMVCNSFVAFFPKQEAATVPIQDQMITVWPLDEPDAAPAKNDDCNHVIDHYDLIAAETAISDAQAQDGNFEGEGPFLVGWSPSSTHAKPDALVLVIDMSTDNSQAQIDRKFQFWKNQIVEDPSKWRNGWSVENVRVAIRNFADQYGPAMLDAVKLFGKK